MKNFTQVQIRSMEEFNHILLYIKNHILILCYGQKMAVQILKLQKCILSENYPIFRLDIPFAVKKNGTACAMPLYYFFYISSGITSRGILLFWPF
ncbi:MAG: hypothetical protein LBP74_09165 [Treponema sp.]|jgi:hypothetical protein|nr:hypothetical protein [Treponema sp.]